MVRRRFCASMAKVAKRDGMDFGWKRSLTRLFRDATPADVPLHDCSPYSHVHVRRESLGFVHQCRPVPTCNVTVRNVFIAVLLASTRSGQQTLHPGRRTAPSVADFNRVLGNSIRISMGSLKINTDFNSVLNIQSINPGDAPCRLWAPPSPPPQRPPLRRPRCPLRRPHPPPRPPRQQRLAPANHPPSVGSLLELKFKFKRRFNRVGPPS